jgi:hypothetical protein
MQLINDQPDKSDRPESPYEAAARVADQVEHGHHYLGNHRATKAAQEIAREIRALPHPPERVLPVFTADWVLDIMLSANNPAFFPEAIASAINARIAASGFAQSGPVDLEKMQEALKKAVIAFCESKDGQLLTVNNFVEHGAKYLDDVGFGLAGEIDHATAEAWDDGFDSGRKSSGMVSGDAVRDLIDAAVLAEREAIAADCEARMQSERVMRDLAQIARRYDMATCHGDRAQAYTEMLNAIRARTTNTETAPDGATGHEDPPSGTTFLPVTEGDAGRALIPDAIYDLAGDAWEAARLMPGSHSFRQTVKPVIEAYFIGLRR